MRSVRLRNFYRYSVCLSVPHVVIHAPPKRYDIGVSVVS